MTILKAGSLLEMPHKSPYYTHSAIHLVTTYFEGDSVQR